MQHREIAVDKAYTFEWKFYEFGIQIIPSSATVSVWTNSGGATVTDASCNIGSDGTVRYIFPAATNAAEDANNKIAVTYTYTSGMYYPPTATITHYELFDVVKTPINNVVSDIDLYDYMPELRDKVYERYGETTAAGSTSTFIDAELQSDTRNWKGGYFELYISNTTVFRASITDFAKATGTVTFSPAYTFLIPREVRYIMRTSYHTVIDRAFEVVRRDLRNKVKNSSRFVDGNVTKNLVVFKTLEILAGARIEQEADRWAIQYTRFGAEYNKELAALQEPADLDDDGNISEFEDESRPSFNSTSVQI